MDVNSASGMLNKGSGMLSSTTNWLSGLINWMFTFRNMLFILLIAGIVFITYKLYENNVNRKKYYYGRNRDI